MYNEKPATVESCLKKARDYYGLKDENGAGGNLHIVLDDGNTAGHHVRWTFERCRRRYDSDGEELALDLLELSEAERDQVYRQLHTRPAR